MLNDFIYEHYNLRLNQKQYSSMGRDCNHSSLDNIFIENLISDNPQSLTT